MAKCNICRRPMTGPGLFCPDCLEGLAQVRSPVRPSPPPTIRVPGRPRCAVCEVGEVAKTDLDLPEITPLTAADPNRGRDRVVAKVLLVLDREGQFTVGGLRTFWEKFQADLCYRCRLDFDAISVHKLQALQLLEEALGLDPDNESARKNLKAIGKSLPGAAAE